jgi:photosystem I P700 chlorophyll a apoprotein A1
MSALGRPQDMFSDTAIQLQPIFAQWIQNIHAGALGVTAPGATTSTSLTWGGSELVVVGGKVALLHIPLGTADFFSPSHSRIYYPCGCINTFERCFICSQFPSDT